jgi:hypothetical protein
MYHDSIDDWTTKIPKKSNLYRWASGIIGSPRKFITISWDGKRDDIVRFNDKQYINRIREDIEKFNIDSVRICDPGYTGNLLRIEVYYSDDYYETLYIYPSNEIDINDQKIDVEKHTYRISYNFAKFLLSTDSEKTESDNDSNYSEKNSDNDSDNDSNYSDND